VRALESAVLELESARQLGPMLALCRAG